MPAALVELGLGLWLRLGLGVGDWRREREYLSGLLHRLGRRLGLRVRSLCSMGPSILLWSFQQSVDGVSPTTPGFSSQGEHRACRSVRLTTISTSHTADNDDTTILLIFRRRIRVVAFARRLRHGWRPIFQREERCHAVGFKAIL